MSNWTKVEDALPDPYKDCYVTYQFASGSRRVVESYITKDDKWAFLEPKYNRSGYATRKAIAWMYKVKPVPYGEEKKVIYDEDA